MTESSELQQLRKEIIELRLLYRMMVESLIPVEEASRRWRGEPSVLEEIHKSRRHHG